MREPSQPAVVLPVVSPGDTSGFGRELVARTAAVPPTTPSIKHKGAIVTVTPTVKRAPYADAGGDRWTKLSSARYVVTPASEVSLRARMTSVRLAV
jgi:hypothetical protein